MEYWLLIGIVFIVGFLAGLEIKAVSDRKNSAGGLFLETLQPGEDPYMFVELDEKGMSKIKPGNLVHFVVKDTRK